jgi:hypothetical protein
MKYEHIRNWINHISIPRNELGGFSVCPYSKGAEYQVIDLDKDNIVPPENDFEVIIYILPDRYNIDELYQLAFDHNEKYTNLVFLPDHKDRYTEINGVQTNNGKYNLILCQPRDKLAKARNKLEGTSYYTYWASDYLKEILNT